MIDWGARIDEMMHICERDYDMHDREALEILLSALVDCPRTPQTWLILETSWWARNCDDGWFALGGTWSPASCQSMRGGWPRELAEKMAGLMDAPAEPQLFIEPVWDKYPYWREINYAVELLSRSLRVRVPIKRTSDPLRSIDLQADERRYDALGAAADAVLSDRVKARRDSPPAFRDPPEFLYQVETLQRLSPWFLSWNMLVKNLGALAVRHAYLYGRDETGPDENRIMARAARDSVPVWVQKAALTMKSHGTDVQLLEKAMLLGDRMQKIGNGAHGELTRLRRGGIFHHEPYRGKFWTLGLEHRAATLAIVEGQAFDSRVLAAAS